MGRDHTKILVPLDGSDFSRTALASIQRLFGPDRCTLTLLRVGTKVPAVATPRPPAFVQDGWSRLIPDYRSEADRDNAMHPVIGSQVWDALRTELDDSMSRDLLALRQAGFAATSLVRLGDPVEEILDVAESGGFDLIAMATHGRTGIQRVLVGSVAQGVLGKAHVDVMLLKAGRNMRGSEELGAQADDARARSSSTSSS